MANLNILKLQRLTGWTINYKFIHDEVLTDIAKRKNINYKKWYDQNKLHDFIGKETASFMLA